MARRGGLGGRPPGRAERGHRRRGHRRGDGRRGDGGIGARGYLDGRALAEVFAWLRPDDLIWNYWVNNYLQGRPPPAFDILYWNADTTRLPAALHRDFIKLALANALTVPDEATMLGSPVDLSKVDVDAYVIAGAADHLCPWQSCYRTTRLLGGQVTFVLSTSGHIAAMVNPPDNPKAAFQTAPSPYPADPQRVPRRGADGGGQLVAPLFVLAGRAERRAEEEPRPARPEGLPDAERRARNLCPRPLSSAASRSAASCCGWR